MLTREGKDDSAKLEEIDLARDQKERLPVGQLESLVASLELKDDFALEIVKEYLFRASM